MLFLQKTYHSQFRPLLMLLSNETSYPPTNNDTPFQRTALSMHVTKPSECDIRQVCTFIKSNQFTPFPKTVCFFVTDVFSTVTQKSANR